MNFADVERDYIRQHILPDFEWAHYSEPSRINPLRKPIELSRVAFVTTGGVHLKSDRPFNYKNRTGDTSYRIIPSEAEMQYLALSHLGYDTAAVSKDINSVFPLERLRELRDEGLFLALTDRHFSFMGYMPHPHRLLQETGPEVAAMLKEDGADLVLLAPA